jgi:hypothetical protein
MLRFLLRTAKYFCIFSIVLAAVLSIATIDFWIAEHSNFFVFFIVVLVELCAFFSLIEATD